MLSANAFYPINIGKNGRVAEERIEETRKACQEKKKGDYKFISLQSPKPGTGRVVFRRPVEGGPTVHLSPQTSANAPFSNKRKPVADDTETLCQESLVLIEFRLGCTNAYPEK